MSQSSPEIVASTHQLCKKYGNNLILDNLNLKIPRGQCLGLLGPNGSGKTTTIRILLGLSSATSGSCEVFGMNVATHGSKIRMALGVVPQSDQLDPDFSVYENLIVYASYFGIQGEKAKDTTKRLLDEVSLSAHKDKKIQELSGGMLRRLSLARSLVNNPQILILDEPTTGLDPRARQSLWEQLYKLKKQGTTLLLTTHYMDEAQRFCDYIVFLNQGKQLQEGTVQELISLTLHSHVLEISTDDLMHIETNKLNSNAEIKKAGSVSYLSCNDPAPVEKMLQEKKIAYTLRAPNLEDAFIQLAGVQLD